MHLNKINKKHSKIFLSISLSLLFLKLFNLSINIPFVSIICFFLIITIGISHGALDNLKGYKLLKIYKIRQKSLFYFAYIIISLFIIFLWITYSSIILFLFLLVAAFHFGKEDSNFHAKRPLGYFNSNYLIDLNCILKGSIVILAPLYFHTEETLNIFDILSTTFTSNLNAYYITDKGDIIYSITENKFFLTLFILSFFSNFFVASNKFINVTLADWIAVIVLNFVFIPLVAFTIYFCFLHSIRHSISLSNELNRKNIWSGFIKFMNKALPLTIITGVLYLFAVFILTNSYNLDDAILKVIFIGLASLTFPHILLEYLVEKNEK